ncbi:GNAT family N-acetyltransferase [Nocardioides piscis]|uniref:GNAT family N-acetyltransferase n=1 Tax=Nocardioides piscis TaxID=2714938 RepID=UPI001FE82121|nr:GNAT family N-acetyltransferase [Nocardioides piscis]
MCLAAYEPFFTGAEDFYRERVGDVARRDAEAEVWVAVDGDEVLGCVTYCPPGSVWREISRDDEGEFRMLSVAPSARGRGVGMALARTCEERARSHGAVAMVLSSLAVMTAAHAVYARLGYERLPERDWSPAPDVHLIAFGKQLD